MRVSASEPSPYRRGLVAGALSVLLLEVVGVAVLARIRWAEAHLVKPGFASALSEPLFSISDVITTVMILLLLAVIYGSLTMLRGSLA